MSETYSNSTKSINNNDNNQNESNNKKQKINIVTKVHNTDKPNFNYQQKEVLSSTTNINESSYYTIDIHNKFQIYNEQNKIDKNYDILFRIRKNKDGDFEIISPIEKMSYSDVNLIDQLDGKMWLVMKSEDEKGKFNTDNEEYNLLENDIIRIADKKYVIIEKNIKNKSNSQENKNKINIINEKFGPVLENEIDEEHNYVKDGEKCIKCDSSEDDQKLKLCDCPKHYECLKKEIKENIKTNKNSKETVTSYKCENYNCPTCKKPYPFKFIYKGQEFELIDIERPSKDEDYIILESLTFIKNGNNIKNIFVVKLTEENLTIGRNDKENKIENDINDEEVTISRSHAILKFNKENGNLTIINDKGRYGVLVLIKDNIKLTANEKIYFQVGKTYVEAEVKVY